MKAVIFTTEIQRQDWNAKNGVRSMHDVADKPKLTAIAPWLGGKRTMAATIVRELGAHHSYWEPFCGSCAVLFSKPPSRQETVCDLHSDLINLARVLADEIECVRLYYGASRVLSSTKLYKDFCRDLGIESPSDRTDRALAFLVASWQGRNGTSGSLRTNFAPSIRFTSGGGSSPTRWRAVAESIPGWHDRLRNVSILDHDAFDVLPKIADETGTAIYADPPYLLKTRGSGSGSRYKHDFGDSDHVRLRDELSRFKLARVVVSYYDDPVIRDLYAGWTFMECSRQKNLHVQNRRGNGRCVAPEVLILNGPSYQGT